MPLNTEVDYNNVIIKGTVELGVKGERGLQGFKGDQGVQGIQGPPVPVANELGDDPDIAVSQKLLTDYIAGKVDKVVGKQLSDENYTLAEKDKLSGIASEATKNRADSENADKAHTHTTAQVSGLGTAATKNVGTGTGQVMQVGAFGLGSTAPIADIDIPPDAIRFITKLVGSAHNTAPFIGSAGAVVIQTKYGSASWGAQLILGNGDNPALGYRGYHNTQEKWTPWREILHTGNLLQTTGTSTEFPMSQAATTIALSGKADKVSGKGLSRDIELIAHRGFTSIGMQNTMLAISAAFSAGADSIEVDIQSSTDGVLYLFHDDTVDLLTDGTGRFADKTSAEIEQLKYESLIGTLFEDTKVTRFDYFVDWAARHGAFIYPEFKGVPNSKITEIIDIVVAANHQMYTVFQSGAMSRVEQTLTYRDDTMCGFLSYSTNLAELKGYVDILSQYPDRAYLILNISSITTTPSIVSYCRENGVEIAAYTVNNPTQAEQLIKLGVYKIMSNLPLRIR